MFSKNALRINLVDNEWVSVFFHLWLLGAKLRGCVARTLVLFQQDTVCVPTGSVTYWIAFVIISGERKPKANVIFKMWNTIYSRQKCLCKYASRKFFFLSYFVKEYKSKINKNSKQVSQKNLLLDHLLNIKISWLIHIPLCTCNKAWTKTSDRRKCNTFIFLNE